MGCSRKGGVAIPEGGRQSWEDRGGSDPEGSSMPDAFCTVSITGGDTKGREAKELSLGKLTW